MRPTSAVWKNRQDRNSSVIGLWPGSESNDKTAPKGTELFWIFLFICSLAKKWIILSYQISDSHLKALIYMCLDYLLFDSFVSGGYPCKITAVRALGSQRSFYCCFQLNVWFWSSDRALAASGTAIKSWLEIRAPVRASFIIKCTTGLLKLPMISTASLSRVASAVSVRETHQNRWADNFNPILWFGSI